MMKTTTDLLDKSLYDDISRREKSNILRFFWLDLYHNLVDVTHTHIYIRGLGTFETRYKKLKELEIIYKKKIENLGTSNYNVEEKERILEDYVLVLNNVQDRLKEIAKIKEKQKEFKNNESRETTGDIQE